MKILLAGATGAVGRELLTLLVDAGHEVRTLSRRPVTVPGVDVRRADLCVPASLAGVCDDIDVVVSCVGAPLDMKLRERRSFDAIDRVGNQNLVAVAQRACVKRFVYLAANVAPTIRDTRYIRAHEAVVATLASSGMRYRVVRPTGIYVAFGEFIALARSGIGVVPVVGSPNVISNPVHERDVARALLACVDDPDDGAVEVRVGGPEELTRRRCAELAFAALDRAPRIVRLPMWLFMMMGFFLRPLHPRLADLLAFIAALGGGDALAPKVGTLRLADYYREVAQK